jgi:hypothetical protein
MTEPNSEPLTDAALAALPREQVGPFLILGVAKNADNETIEAAWALRVLWARQGKTRVPLEDIHWARSVLRDSNQRLAADAGSLNPDIASDELRRLTKLWNLDAARPAWTPLDPDLSSVPADVPDPAAVSPTMTAPAVPVDLPGVARWLDEFARAPLDPWGLALPSTRAQDLADG